MNLPKFKNYISNTIAGCLFEHLNIYEENLFSKDSHFEVCPFTMPHTTKEEMELYHSTYREKQKFAEALNKSPNKDDVLNKDFSFVIHFDSIAIETGISLKNLIKMSKKLHTDLIFVNGDGADYQLGEFTSGHDSEVILHIQFKGVKNDLINDYENWYAKRHDFLAKKIEDKNNKVKHKK